MSSDRLTEIQIQQSMHLLLGKIKLLHSAHSLSVQ
jgi:hypothetical protein